MTAHLDILRQNWKCLESFVQGNSIFLDGSSLTIPAVVAVARYSTAALIDKSDQLMQRLRNSVDTLTTRLERGEQVYGVNTGCGGNADTRTKKLQTLQHSFLQHHQCGILPDLVMTGTSPLPNMDEESQSLSTEVVRGTMLLRCNSLLRGHSAVRIEVIDLLLRAMNEGFVPIIPLRGSISASGDLSPLSYVGGLIEGNSDIFVQVRDKGTSRVISAEEALRKMQISPITLNAKEGLGIMNGTAASAAAAALALHDSHNLGILTQLLTAMATEALLGSIDNYNEFISQCRPHPGQAEVALNIRTFLAGTHLCGETDVYNLGLVQDRYALRTAPQWIGPQIEDLLSADRQMSVEINSTTDNPLIDVEQNRFHHGGNFQAASVTSAMEKTRSALTMLGRILLGQCGELINPSLSRGLPPNLCSDDPSISFAVKGLDIHMTAYFSELAYLANSVASHVQSAEMNNQTVNSLALISARYTSQSVQLVSMMCAAHLYILCQALDLRALTMEFLIAARSEAKKAYNKIFAAGSEPVHTGFEANWSQITSSWLETTQLDLTDRCDAVAANSFGYILNSETNRSNCLSPSLCSSAQQWKGQISTILFELYGRARADFTRTQSTPSYLGKTTKATYQFVRDNLGIPFHQGIRDHPTISDDFDDGVQKKSIGSYVSRIYLAVRSGEIMKPIQSTMHQS